MVLELDADLALSLQRWTQKILQNITQIARVYCYRLCDGDMGAIAKLW